tara:strand:- start:4581 stop:4787 length:207 start_codon:yes stop_codon:yes gene_type:complete
MKYVMLMPVCMLIASCGKSYTTEEVKTEYKGGYYLKGTAWGDDNIKEIHNNNNNKTWSNLKKELRYNK